MTVTDPGGWEIINLVGRFETGERRQVVRAKLVPPELDRDLWLRRIVWTVRQQAPTFAVANFEQFDFKMRVSEPVSHLIAPDFTPLENIEIVFECVAPWGLYLRPGTKFEALFRNPRVLRAWPVDVIVSLHCSLGSPPKFQEKS